MKRFLQSALLFLIALFFVSCKRGESHRIYLDGTFSYALCDESSLIDQADNFDYRPLEGKGFRNISKAAGSKGSFVWLRTTFRIPGDLHDRDLSMVIPYLHYACELYLNGEFINSYGVMRASEQDAGYKSQLFDFPEDFLDQNGENIVHIKVLSLGSATISRGVFVGGRDDCKAESNKHSFWQSRIYIFFEGCLLEVFLIFLMLYFSNRKYRYYLFFSLLNFVSAVFFSSFFAGELPGVAIPFFLYLKLARCVALILIEVTFTMFVFSFLDIPHRKIETISRWLFSVASILLILLAKDYQALMRLSPFILAIVSTDVVLTLIMVIASVFSAVEDRSKKAKFLVIALTPLLCSFAADIIIKLVLNNILITYFALPAFIVTIFFIFSYFTMQLRSISGRVEYLNRSLEDEVELQTRKLIEANEKLEQEQEAAQEDMSMAALVQKKFFHAPNRPLAKWEVAVRYEPLSIVSGDLFNFYVNEDDLDGVSLFDASGHGVAASLVTMLAENIIQNTYHEFCASGIGVADILTKINDRFITAKDDIENYLTGILLSTKENPDGSCTVTMANAGHPSPLLYVAASGQVEEILPDVSQPSFGAVGIRGFDVCYAEIEFTMNSGDVLLLFTDGLIEMMDENHEEFGISRVMTVLDEIHGMSAPEMLSALMFAFNAHVYGVPRTDDVSVIVLKRK